MSTVVRHLASVQRVLAVDPIPGADAIEVATVKGWKVVVKKGEYAPGDLGVYCEIDAFLPVRPEYEFLRRSSYRKLPDGPEGFRLRTVKLRGQISQGLMLPLARDAAGHPRVTAPDGACVPVGEGDDVTALLGIVKYEPPVPASLSGTARGPLPSFLEKTDEERVQNLPELFESPPAGPFYVTEKLDGASATFYVRGDRFGVCSRSLDLLEAPGNMLWRFARSTGLEEKMRGLGRDVALQGELVGEGVQKNPYRIEGQTVRFFTLFDVDTYRRLPLADLRGLCEAFGLETVPVLVDAMPLPPTVDAVLALADGPSALNPDTKREGVVMRSHDSAVSFKAISNAFLLAEE